MTTATIPEAPAKERLKILRNAKSIALVGVSANPLRSSNFVATYLVRTLFPGVCGEPGIHRSPGCEVLSDAR